MNLGILTLRLNLDKIRYSSNLNNLSKIKLIYIKYIK